MLWLKGWLETRWRLVAALGFLVLILILAWQDRGVSSPQETFRLLNILTVLWMFSALVLAGAGINTQSAFRAMTDASPLITHALPWTAMGISIGIAGIFFMVALRVVETREY